MEEVTRGRFKEGGGCGSTHFTPTEPRVIFRRSLQYLRSKGERSNIFRTQTVGINIAWSAGYSCCHFGHLCKEKLTKPIDTIRNPKWNNEVWNCVSVVLRNPACLVDPCCEGEEWQAEVGEENSVTNCY